MKYWIKIIFLCSRIIFAKCDEEELLRDTTLVSLNGSVFKDDLENVSSLDFDKANESSGIPISSSVTKYPILIPNVTSDEIDDEPHLRLDPLYEDYQSHDGIRTDLLEPDRISTSNYSLRACGRKEACPSPDAKDFMRDPFYCRCDKGVCEEYGDCCPTVADPSKLVQDNPWRCQLVQHEMIWALMISKCRNGNSAIRKHCESPDLIPEKSVTCHHDIPVYDNISQVLYRNIFCAQCNAVPPQNLYKMPLRIMCSDEFKSDAERDFFVSNARYIAGERLWTDDKTYCEIYAPDLDGNRVTGVIPSIRFCRRNAIDVCPKAFEKKKENAMINRLCRGYTQYIKHRGGAVFKNPHCALCHNFYDPKEYRCLHEQSSLSQFDSKISPSAAGVSLNSSGLSLLFDFDIGREEEGFVGFDMTCKGNRIWDFLRQKCTEIECPTGQVLDPSSESCHPENDPNRPENHHCNANLTFNSCFILLIQEHEYTLLDNNSVLINCTRVSSEWNSGAPETLLLHPGEYCFRNGTTTLEICARDISHGIIQRFSAILNYLSRILLWISVFFSALHLLIFCLLPKMRNLPAKNLCSLTLSLFISQLLFLTMIGNKNELICKSSGLIMHYFFLASFFWMNVMSFDIWRTFSSALMTPSRLSNNRTFIKYSGFGWLVPGFIVSGSALTEFGLTDEFRDSWPILWRIRPLYGHNNLCWITQGLSLFVFFALPVLIIISLNILFFSLTTKAIMDKSENMFFGPDKRIKRWTKGGPKGSGDDMDRMKMYVKLGLIMGVTWILGFLSNLPGWRWLSYPFVILNGLQGTFIFFAFDFKFKVWEMMRNEWVGGGNTNGPTTSDTNSPSQIISKSSTEKTDVSHDPQIQHIA